MSLKTKADEFYGCTSEHYCAEKGLVPGHSHGELVGPGIITMARLQGLDPAPLSLIAIARIRN